MTRSQKSTACGFAAIVGPTNAGKSTLVNRLVGAHVSIVTPKVQTTRSRLRGIFIDGDAQVVLVDTPGIFKPRRKLDEAMLEAAWLGAGEGDVVVLVVDARKGLDAAAAEIIDRLGGAGAKTPVFLVFNKIDAIRRDRLLALTRLFHERGAFAETFMISALTGDGVDDLKKALAAAMPPGPWHYPPDQLADLPLRLMAAEFTREQLFTVLHQELPYALTVETDSYDERKDGSVRIEQTVYVMRESHRKIVLGKGGATIKKVGQAAREALSRAIGAKVHLFLFVKVRAGWDRDPERLRNLGLG